MEIENIKIKDIKPYEKNPRNNSKAIDALCNSIKNFGFQVPLILDKNKVIVCGHTRWKAAKKLGLIELPCKIASELSPKQIKAYRLADNKTAELSSWDEILLAEELKDLDLFDLNFSMEDFGFELGSLTSEVKEDDCDIQSMIETIDVPKTKKGEIWQLGRHRLLCGDATHIDDVKSVMKDDVADLYLTDPPYNVDYNGKAGKIQNDNMKDKEFREFLRKAFENAEKILKPGASFYIWHADSEGYNFRGACNDVNFQVRQCLVWIKSSMVLGRQDYQWKHEPCLYGWKDGGMHFWNSDRKQTTVLEFDKPSKNQDHPTMKPILLFDYLIKNSTKSKSIVFDGFAGSGTTILACEQNNRIARCIELDEKYCDVIIKRWESLTGCTAELIVEDNGKT